MASIPQGQDDLFPGASLNNNLEIGYKRAKLAWYTIDPLFFRNTFLSSLIILFTPFIALIATSEFSE